MEKEAGEGEYSSKSHEGDGLGLTREDGGLLLIVFTHMLPRLQVEVEPRHHVGVQEGVQSEFSRHSERVVVLRRCAQFDWWLVVICGWGGGRLVLSGLSHVVVG